MGFGIACYAKISNHVYQNTAHHLITDVAAACGCRLWSVRVCVSERDKVVFVDSSLKLFMYNIWLSLTGSLPFPPLPSPLCHRLVSCQ